MSKFLKQYFGLYFGILIGVIWISGSAFLTPYLIIAASKPYENKKQVYKHSHNVKALHGLTRYLLNFLSRYLLK
jgi:hypothetical protein